MSQYVMVSEPKRVTFAEKISVSKIPVNHKNDISSCVIQNINYHPRRIMPSHNIFENYINTLLYCTEGLDWDSKEALVGTHKNLLRYLKDTNPYRLIIINGEWTAEPLTLQQITVDMLKIYKEWMCKKAAVLCFKSSLNAPYEGDSYVFRPKRGYFKTGKKIKFAGRLRIYLVHVLKATNPILCHDAATIIQSAIRLKLVRNRIKKEMQLKIEDMMKQLNGALMLTLPTIPEHTCGSDKFYRTIDDPNVVCFMQETYQ